MDDQLTPPIIPFIKPATPKSNKVKFLFFIIIGLMVLLIVAFAYIQAQKSTKVGQSATENNNKNDSVEIFDNQAGASPAGTREILPGASLVNPDRVVLDTNYEVASNEAIPNSPSAPKSVVIDIKDLPKEVLNLEIGNGKITPSSFTVKTGALISLAVTSVDDQTHVFIFTDQAVGAIAMGISPGQTKAINFNAPAPGEYTFDCEIPIHKNAGEVGVMIVK